MPYLFHQWAGEKRQNTAGEKHQSGVGGRQGQNLRVNPMACMQVLAGGRKQDWGWRRCWEVPTGLLYPNALLSLWVFVQRMCFAYLTYNKLLYLVSKVYGRPWNWTLIPGGTAKFLCDGAWKVHGRDGRLFSCSCNKWNPVLSQSLMAGWWAGF